MTAVLSTSLENSAAPASSATAELLVVGLGLHRGHSSFGIPDRIGRRCVSACPPNGASDRRRWLAQGLRFMAGLPAGWLFALHAASLQMDAGTAEAMGLKIPSRSSSRPLHRDDEAHSFTRERRPSSSVPPSSPKPNLFASPSFVLLFLRFLLLQVRGVQTQQNMERGPRGSVALAC